MLPFEFHPLAEKDLAKEIGHFESVQAGKGLELLVQIQKVIQQIQEFPESAPVSHGTVRSIVVKPSNRWEFTLHYRAKPDVIRILAVAHHKRQPFYWFGRR